jgi:hypothetical protein
VGWLKCPGNLHVGCVDCADPGILGAFFVLDDYETFLARRASLPMIDSARVVSQVLPRRLRGSCRWAHRVSQLVSFAMAANATWGQIVD